MKKTNIIFFVENTFNKRDYHRFGIEILRNRGFDVEIWDFSPLLRPKFFQNYTPPDPINFHNHYIIRNKSEAKLFLQKLKPSNIVVAIIEINRVSRFIFKYLSANRIYYGLIVAGVIPVVAKPLACPVRLKRAIKDPLKLSSKISYKIEGYFGRKYPGNFCIIGGSYAQHVARKQNSFDKNTKIISAHTLDYDRFLEEENSKEEKFNFKQYAVMLDEFGPFHPDLLNSGNEPDCTVDNYYPPLNKFFNQLENQLRLQVVIAAHPRSSYDKMKNPFNRRIIIRGQTIKLIKNAKLVIAHASTAINFAILCHKPIMFITSSDYSINYQHSIEVFAKTLSKTPIDLSKQIINIPNDVYLIDESAYKSYKEMYIKAPGTPDKFLWDIFADFINEE